MKINGYEIKPGANLQDADLEDADLEDANLTGTILEKKEETQDDTSLSQKVKELEEENKKLKEALKALLDTP